MNSATMYSASSVFLSDRDLQILNYVADGLTDIEIGEKLDLSSKTINHRIEGLKRQLNVKTRMQVVVTALRNKWIF